MFGGTADRPIFRPPKVQTRRDMAREIIQLQCTECKRKNYSTTKNKRNTPGRLEIKKYCPFDRKHTVHRESK
jgi:large subunit ribosomal protein L33